MNTNGGDLYMGVADDGCVVGIDHDLAELETVRLLMNDKTDAGWSYPANLDGYKRKLTNAVRFYLGDAAPALMDEIEELVDEKTGLRYVKIHVRPSDEIIYLGRSESVVYRAGASVVFLSGRQRDQYVKTRFFMRGTKSAATAVAEFEKLSILMGEQWEKQKQALEKKILEGTEITVTGAHHFTEEAVMAANKVKSLAWDGAHYVDVSSWQMLVLKVLEKLQEIDAAKFDELAEKKEFGKHLIKVIKPRERHPDCYKEKFGADGKVRIKKSLGNKMYLWREDMVLRKIIAAFGVDVEKFMFVAG